MTLEERVAALEAQVTAQDAPTDYYTSVYSGEQIDQAVRIALNGSAGENFLDNAYFVGGGSQQGGGQFPINQRGQTSWSAAGPMFDRWKLVSGTASLTAAGVTLNGTMAQVLENDPPGATTATALTTTGIVDCTYDSGAKTFTITGTGETFLAAKLELGSTQSLALEDDSGNLHVLEIPKFGAELAECQRYLFKIGDTIRYCSLGNGVARDGQFVSITIPTPITMRTVPVLIATPGGFTMRHNDTVLSGGANFTIDAFSQNSIMLKVQSKVALTPGDMWEAFLEPNGSLVFSAEL